MKQEGVDASQVPSEMVTASGGGHGSAHSAERGGAAGGARGAAGGVPVERVRELIRAHTEPPTLGFLGRARVNVLELNLALDETLGAPTPVERLSR